MSDILGTWLGNNFVGVSTGFLPKTKREKDYERDDKWKRIQNNATIGEFVPKI
jgi:hypothetical protein